MKNKSNWILLGPFVAFVVFVLVYYGIYSRGTGEQDLASAADDPIVYDPVPPHLFVGSCTGCQLKYFPKDVVAFEDELVCTPERNYLAHQISQNPITLTADRKDYSEAQFPKSCVVFIQKTFWDAYREPARMFSYCASDRGEPQTGRLVPCVNREYVNVVYHSLVDVADCLNIPQKFLLPKLLNESGLHINTLGAGKDGGVGQMTKPAIQAVLNDIYSDRRGYSVLDHYRAEMRKSGKASCQRLLRHPEAFEKVIPDDTERCNLMGGGANPLRNLVYTGVFYRTMMELAAGIHYRAGKDVVIHRDGRVEEVSPDKNFTPRGYLGADDFPELFARAGVENANMHAAMTALITLGFNAGVGSARVYFRNYLKKRIEERLPITRKDIDFINTNTAPLGKLTNPAKNPVDEAKRLIDLANARKTAHLLTMPEYVRLIQNSGFPGYLSIVGFRHRQLNRLMGENVCTSADFLKF